ncbi:hypothetical protein AKJ40_02675 [candidate division MSBL1 archaeon SCGC-AAA259M10]|uniref:Uncharacterized protein n=1 Tax=candidate division MSBL1 archaeon SCGC-AAA259M10 TaxID=1698270 RepID=A0A133UZP0_9EURY|nr:hypothetical protein AKJ40_02675 [candidate division MSBL1 archaeon SCGC-AAA259M10]
MRRAGFPRPKGSSKRLCMGMNLNSNYNYENNQIKALLKNSPLKKFTQGREVETGKTQPPGLSTEMLN